MKRLITLLAVLFLIAAAQAQNITNAEYFFDADPGPGNGTAITVSAPGTVVNINTNISTALLGAGFHFVGVRVKDATGFWGLFEKRGFYISGNTTDAANINAAEYFFDTDPGVGNGTSLAVGASGSTVNFTANIPTSLASGFHFLSIRVKGSDGQWGLYEKRGFYISSATIDASNITAAEYFFDTDPGVGNATALSVGATGAVVNFTANIPTSLGPGFHFLAIRVKGSNGQWGLYEKRGLYVSSATVDASNITAAEYFFDTDPGVGNATATAVGTNDAIVNFTANLPTSLSPGFHFLAIRTKGADGKWGLYEKRGFYVSTAASDMGNIVAAEYFFDTDPGIGKATALTVTTPGATVTQTFLIPEPSLTLGRHYLSIRVKDANGIWGLYQYDSLTIGNSTISCPANASATTTAGNCFVTVNNIDPVISPPQAYTYTLTGATTGTASGTASGASFNAGVTTVNYKLTGSPTVNCSFTVTITATAPTISVQPSNQSGCAGTNVTFSVTATGTNLVYQWRKAGVNINGATSSTYTITGVTTGNAGSYDVVVSSPCNLSVTSAAATLTVGNTAITSQPSNQAVCAGTIASFSVTATGSNLTYQWRKGGINITGATSSIYTVNNVGTGDAGNYDVVVTGTCGSVASNSAALTVNAATIINTNPANQNVCAGSNVIFTAAASGTGTITYQWRKSGVNINGATAASFTINAAGAGDAGVYDVVATGTCGAAISSGALLTVNTATVINTQPSNQSSCLGGNVTFTVAASGTNLSYQWRKGGADITGATSASYTINNVSAADAANYSVVVSGSCGTVTSNNAAFSITAGTTINTQPSNQSSCLGGSATFNVSASGSGTVTYQWKKNGTNINGAASSSLTINPVTAGDATSYSVVVSSACGNTESNTATLSILAATAITAQPVNQTVCPGVNATFTITATGTGILTYQWRKGGVNISGANAASYAINNVLQNDEGNYDVVVTGTCGAVTSATVVLALNAVTAINTQPSNQSSCLGGSVTFTVEAAGVNLTYQWKKAGVDIAGAASSNYTVSNIVAGDAATYSVTVNGLCGAVTSSDASLGIAARTTINTQPADQTSCLGGSVAFNVAASGSGTLTYQWKKNGTNINGATSSSFTVNPVTAGDATSYTVVVSSSCGNTESNTASLTILQATAITAQPISQSVCTGGGATFTVTAAGDNLTYQWRKGGTNIAGANASSYSIAAVAAGDVGSYDVVVTGTCGAVTSNAVSLSTGNIVINTQPASQTVCEGGNVTFNVTAAGTGLAYQWRKTGVDIPNATASSFTINSIVEGDAGDYDVVISSTCGATTSSAAALTVNYVPAITVQPTAQAVCAGSNVSFSVTASGTSISYQWRKDGVNITGATLSSYNISNAAGGDAGNYTVVISGACSPSAVSSPAALTVNQPPSIATQPANQTVFTGSNVTITVAATGTVLTYQWRKDGVDITGAIDNSYTINNLVVADAGSYDVVISGTCPPSVTSNAALLTVNPFAITTQPSNKSVCEGGNATFTLVASGTGLTYQWQVKTVGDSFTDIDGATDPSYTVSSATASQSGNQYRCVVSGSLNSNTATLTVNTAPAVAFNLPFDTLYINSDNQLVTGGSPAGGLYSGSAVTSGFIKPADLSVGNYGIIYHYTDANGCTATATDSFNVLPKTYFVSIYPNPSTGGVVNIVVAEESIGKKAIIYDAAARKVYEWTIAGRSTILNLNLPAGTYFLAYAWRYGFLREQLLIMR